MRIVIIERDGESQPTYTYFIDDKETMETLSDLIRTLQNQESAKKHKERT